MSPPISLLVFSTNPPQDPNDFQMSRLRYHTVLLRNNSTVPGDRTSVEFRASPVALNHQLSLQQDSFARHTVSWNVELHFQRIHTVSRTYPHITRVTAA
jgi:hypothetical protein